MVVVCDEIIASSRPEMNEVHKFQSQHQHPSSETVRQNHEYYFLYFVESYPPRRGASLEVKGVLLLTITILLTPLRNQRHGSRRELFFRRILFLP